MVWCHRMFVGILEMILVISDAAFQSPLHLSLFQQCPAVDMPSTTLLLYLKRYFPSLSTPPTST